MDELIPNGATAADEAVPAPVGPTTQIVRELTTPQGAQRYLEDLREQLAEPDMQAIDAIVAPLDMAYKEAVGIDTPDGRAAATEAAEAKDAARQKILATYGWDTWRRHGQLHQDLQETETTRYVKVRNPNQAMDLVRGIVEEATNYDNPVQPPFIDAQELDRFAEAHQQGREILAVGASDIEPLDVPLSMFVSAEGFHSWEEGRGLDTEGRPTSADKIEDFASRDTPIPPIGDVTFYLLPDGQLIAKTGNSHRVAAALKRGDSTIPFNGALGGATIRQLDAIPPVLEQPQHEAEVR